MDKLFSRRTQIAGIAAAAAFFAATAAPVRAATVKTGKVLGRIGQYSLFTDARVRPDGSTLSLLYTSKPQTYDEDGFISDSVIMFGPDGAQIGGTETVRKADASGNVPRVSAIATAPDGRMAFAMSYVTGQEQRDVGFTITILDSANKPLGFFQQLARDVEYSRVVKEIIPAADGGFAAVGTYKNKEKAPKSFFVKIGADGKSKLFTEIQGVESLETISQTPAGDYLIAGHMTDGGYGGVYASRIGLDWSVKFANKYTALATSTVVSSVTASPDGNIIIAGYSPSQNHFLYKESESFIWETIISATGAVVTSRTLGFKAGFKVAALTPMPGGGYIAAGAYKTADGSQEAFIQKISAGLEKTEWAKPVAPPDGTEKMATSYATGIRPSPDGGCVMTGITATGVEQMLGNYSAWIAKFDSAGNPVW